MDNLNDCISQDIVAEYILAPVRSELNIIPGVKEDVTDRLNSVGVTNTFQLIGTFLSFKRSDQTSLELRDSIINCFKKLGVNLELITVNTIMEKIDTMIPGFCDLSEIR